MWREAEIAAAVHPGEGTGGSHAVEKAEPASLLSGAQ